MTLSCDGSDRVRSWSSAVGVPRPALHLARVPNDWHVVSESISDQSSRPRDGDEITLYAHPQIKDPAHGPALVVGQSQDNGGSGPWIGAPTGRVRPVRGLPGGVVGELRHGASITWVLWPTGGEDTTAFVAGRGLSDAAVIHAARGALTSSHPGIDTVQRVAPTNLPADFRPLVRAPIGLNGSAVGQHIVLFDVGGTSRIFVTAYRAGSGTRALQRFWIDDGLLPAGHPGDRRLGLLRQLGSTIVVLDGDGPGVTGKTLTETADLLRRNDA